MAAVLGTLAGLGGGELAKRGAAELVRYLKEMEEDPIHVLIQFLNKIGLISVGVGAAMGVIGYFLKSAAGNAAANATSKFQSMSGVFGNVKFSPTSLNIQSVTTGNAIQDIDNFVSDVESFFHSAASDVSAAAGSTLTTIEDIPKALWLGITSIPVLIWDFLVWAVGGAGADVANYVYPYFILGGLICFVVAAVLSYFQKYIRPTFTEKWDEFNNRLMKTKVGPALNRIFRLPGDEPLHEPGEVVREPKHYEKAPLRLSEPPEPTEPHEVYSKEAWDGYLSSEDKKLLNEIRRPHDEVS